MRQRYFVIVSVAYLGLGVVIATRSVLAHAVLPVVLGGIFILLGCVRLRDYYRGKRGESA